MIAWGILFVVGLLLFAHITYPVGAELVGRNARCYRCGASCHPRALRLKCWSGWVCHRCYEELR